MVGVTRGNTEAPLVARVAKGLSLCRQIISPSTKHLASEDMPFGLKEAGPLSILCRQQPLSFPRSPVVGLHGHGQAHIYNLHRSRL